MRQPVEFHGLPIGGRAHQCGSDQLEHGHVHIGVVCADEHIQRIVGGGVHQFLNEVDASLFGGQHFRCDAVGLQDRFDQRLDVKELLRLKQIGFALFGRQAGQHGLREPANHALLIGLFDAEIHRNEEQRQFFVGVVIEERRRQRTGVLAHRAGERIEPVAQQLLLELRFFVDVDDLPNLDGDGLAAGRTSDLCINGWKRHTTSFLMCDF